MSGNLISVIIPAYNYAHFLPEAISSILQQTYANWECIIIDDGSTDETKVVAEKFTASDDRIKYYYQANAGLSASRNKGVELAKGEWIQFLDADDLLHPEKFSKQLHVFMNEQDADVVYSDYRWFEQTIQSAWIAPGYYSAIKGDAGKAFLMKWEKGFSIPIHSYLFRRYCFTRWGLFDMQLPTHEDLDLQLRFSLQGAAYVYSEGVMAYYRVHQSSMAKDLTLMHKGYLTALFKVFSNSSYYSSGYRLMALHRYFGEVLNSCLDTIRGKKNKLFTSVSVPGGSVFSFTGIILSPVYLILKLIEKLSR
ncbi:MAG: glycosyltransferase [Bacteroidetes bacterium]|nr:glycosyltransferase [Bacteroidota bacterium]